MMSEKQRSQAGQGNNALSDNQEDKANPASAKKQHDKPEGKPSNKPEDKSAAKPEKKSAPKSTSKPDKKGVETPSTTANKAKGRGPIRLALLLALLLALGAAGGLYYLWQQQVLNNQSLSDKQQTTATRLAALDSNIKHLASSLDAAREDQNRAATERLEQEAALNRLRTRIGQERADWTVAEAEYLLAIANRRLQLEQDVGTALVALESADARLMFLADPAFHPVREQIAIELRALRAMPRMDRQGLALELSSLASAVDALSLPGAPTRSEENSEKTAVSGDAHKINGWRSFISALWSDLRGLVTIRQGVDAAVPLLAPEQQYFLRTNLRLQLESARLALLQKSPEVYRSALTDASVWLTTYFEPKDAATVAMKEALSRLLTEKIVTLLPDIGSSLQTLRQLLKKQRRTVSPKEPEGKG